MANIEILMFLLMIILKIHTATRGQLIQGLMEHDYITTIAIYMVCMFS